MARALPFHAQQLFALLQRLGWSQRQCAAALGVTPQAVNNWASGGMNVPARYRSGLASLVTLAIEQSQATARQQGPEAVAQHNTLCHHAIQQWFLENLDARGVSDRWHAELGRKLALTFKTPLSEQSVAEWKAALALHLEAANTLRGLIQRQERPDAPTMAPFALQTSAAADPSGWFWSLAEDLAGEPLQKSAELQAWNAREFQEWLDQLPTETRAQVEGLRGTARP